MSAYTFESAIYKSLAAVVYDVKVENAVSVEPLTAVNFRGQFHLRQNDQMNYIILYYIAKRDRCQ